MKKHTFLFLALISIISVTLFYLFRLSSSPVYADEIEDLQKQIDQLNKAREQSVNATKPLEGQLGNLKTQLAQIQVQLNNLTQNISQKEKELQVREDNLVVEQALLSSRVRSYYIKSFLTSPLVLLFSSTGSSDVLRDLFYRQVTTQQDQKVIESVASEMIDLSAQKDKLEKDKAQAASLQAQVDQNAKFIAGEIDKAKKYQADLSSQIAQLTAKQQAILAAKNGTFYTTVGDVPLSDDPKASPNYDPGFSPAYGLFSFGAYSHRNGMSQYGAWGRAKSGQDDNAILQAYYGQTPIHRDMPTTINTDQGSLPFETQYLYGIAEMPSTWTDNNSAALKAQAIAARTYAYHYTQGGSRICTNENCQVYSGSKASNPPQSWKDAVDSTKGTILPDGVSAQYSSTTGGYLNTSGWDTKCGNQGCWTPDAYEKIAGSPWFYKGWYTESYDINSATCGRSDPWLHLNEMADILNAYLVQNKPGVDNGRITPVTTSCWGGNPYSLDDLTNLANSVGGGSVSSISSVSVSYSTGGSTSTVTFSTNRGDISINGSDFKTIFNLRAPGYISIKSPLYNVEHK